MTETTAAPAVAEETFAQLGLRPELVQALSAVGYETPTPIQRQTIPLLLAGRDLIGQAQTGTGKTAAFALPILEKLNLNQPEVQALILTPTRELALQVSEALHTYAKNLGRVRVTPIYGGDSMQKQLIRLRGGVHVVVGTPGRVMDHLRRGTLTLNNLKTVVLDEADEMLRMGFQEDVEWILAQAASERQTALFSATLPREVRGIAERYLKNPAQVEIRHKTVTVPTVTQHYLQVLEKQKLDVLTHVLEAEAVPGEAILIFVRTKLRAAELAERLEARGYAVEAMHGDMGQAQRETVIRRMREGLVELVVATDVAARGLDVEHIGHVINYDLPNDPEAYVHRIGRTARAGRAGKATSFATPRENYLMRDIERYTGQKLSSAKVPTLADVAARRRTLFKNRILKTLAEEELEPYISLIEEITAESEHSLTNIAAAAAWLARGRKPLATKKTLAITPEPVAPAPQFSNTDTVMIWIGAGTAARIRPADLVGAIANEANISGKEIGPITIYEDYALVGVPGRHLNKILDSLTTAPIRGRVVAVRRATARDETGRPPRSSPHREMEHAPRRERTPEPPPPAAKKFKPTRRGTKAGKKYNSK
ncbi:MAG: DEAD/DEAH box helicase [Anaerolineales bacterium]|nr:DEAD/DEAH box helicase [Anaerolineales bacterium]